MNRRVLPWADWVSVASSAQASDGQLLFRYARLGEQQAFTLLVKRHGPLVWGLCRRLLRSHQDAEDAFQATFLILSKKAATLRQPDALVNWLYGVAYRTALQLRSRRRVTLPLDATDEPVTTETDTAVWREYGMVIDQAIMQLPGNLRTVFLLSQAEELTTLVVSRRLGIPEGTVVSRLHRARKALQKLLARQGITSAAGAVAVGWSLSLPETLSACTVRTILAATPTAVVAGLAQGVISAMFWIKITTAAVITLTLGLAGTGTATLLAQGSGEVAKVIVPVVLQPPANEKDRLIKELQSKLMESKDREQVLQQQLDSLKKQNVEVKRFLEQGLIGEATRRNNQEAGRDADQQARLEDEKRRAEAAKQLEVQKLRRLEHLAQAQDDLTNKLEKLYHHFGVLEEQAKSVAVHQREYERRMVLLESLQKEISDAKNRLTDEESPKIKSLLAVRDKEQAALQKVQDLVIQHQISPSQKTRLQAQISLHEKLLLEVEEKLLRQQYQLDGK